MAFQTWRTMKIGTPDLRDANSFRTALKAAGCLIHDWASDMLNQPSFTVSATESEIELVRLTVRNLGFPNGANREDIYARAMEQGLALCPPEVGPRLRMEYKDQPNGEWLLVAMEPIYISGGRLGVWRVAQRGRGLWLSGLSGRPGRFWNAGYSWVFVRRKPS